MTVLHFDNSYIFAPNFTGKPDNYWPAGKRYFHVQLEEAEAVQMIADGWSVRAFHGKYYLLVHITAEYDTPVAHLQELFDTRQYSTAEVFIEGASYDHPHEKQQKISARLISITPQQ